jgi:hypothetical protein
VADHSDDHLTFAPTVAPAGVATSNVSPMTPRTASSVRFTPGSIIAGRYRLVALLGRGGMGEVYRADDLTLDQPVALKFLPAGMAADDGRLAQFHNELRVARQVSHKNVCRLYDLGDADGRRFLTMEYIDGEDLGALLRRIGRFPQDKALDIARQLCAGVAAAHERGVVHRDLKPANVMLDGDGNVRITDFGIATAAQDAGGAVVVGTPQYMAPEQLAGAPASVKTDIYALGLILFETFTGRRAFDAKTLADLKELHSTGAFTTPTSIVRDLDPAIERVILRCLSATPDQRPASALTVAAALPGADPLAAALAAGETPSPAMLVAAGETEAIGVGRGVSAVAFVIVCLIVLAAIGPRLSIVGRSPMDKPPAVLADRAQQILTSLGYTDTPTDTVTAFGLNQAIIRWVAANDERPWRWDSVSDGPSAVTFWQRTSPRPMVPQRGTADLTNNDPPMTVSGMTLVIVDSLGRLIEFQAVPTQFESEPGDPVEPRWDALFDAAGLTRASFTTVPPQWSPHDFADTRAAWEGPLTYRPDIRVRVEAAAYRGRPTSMFVLGPWSRPTRMAPLPRSLSQTVLLGFGSLLIVTLVVAALLIARVNVRAQRADRRGAARLAAFVLVGYAINWLLSAHHVLDVQQEISAFTRYFGGVLVSAGLLWVTYLALEPYVRRLWPDGILGWTRLTSGHLRDPRVGRDVLIGCVVAAGLSIHQALYNYLPPFMGYPGPVPRWGNNVNALTGSAASLSIFFDEIVGGIFIAMFVVLAYVLLRLAFRRTPLAIAAAVVLLALFQAQQTVATAVALWIALVFEAVLIAVVITVLVRYGLLVTAVWVAVGNAIGGVPFTYALSHWSAAPSNMAIALVLALTCFGFYAARGGQPLFGDIAPT